MATGRARSRHHADLVNQAAQDLRRLQPQTRLLQGLRQIGDLLAIEV